MTVNHVEGDLTDGDLADVLRNLRGTSGAKLGQLVQLVRNVPKASAALALAERAPYVGPYVRAVLYDLPNDDDALDGLLATAQTVIDALRSDDEPCVVGCSLDAPHTCCADAKGRALHLIDGEVVADGSVEGAE